MIYKKYLRSGKNAKVFEEFKLFQNKIVNLTNDSRDRYYPKYLLLYQINTDSHVSPRAYWSTLKMFFDNKKTPIIPCLFL